MRKYNIPPAFSSSLQLGRQGENGVTEITFLCAGYAKMYGDGFAEAVHRTPDGTTYPVNIEQDENNRVSWLISDGDTATAGTGQLELRWMVNGNLAKSKIFSTIIKSALTAPETPPDAAKSWVDKVLKAAEDIKSGAIDDEKLAKAIAEYLEKHPIESGITEQNVREIAQSIVDAYQEKDPTVPDWAKAETKPTYTAAEVGAVPESAKSDIDKNTSARHTHSNKSALDSISESDIAKWNSGTAGTVEITGATGLAAGSAPTVTETADSTAQARKYTLGIPAGENGADGAKGDKGETGAKGDKGEQGADGKSAYQFAQEAGYTGTEAEFAAKLVQEIPTALPNPNALTFTGAATGSYDGSAPLTLNIPAGGGVTDEQVETAVNAWMDKNGDAALTGGGWRKIAIHVWDGNTEYQPLTLDYATGEMTFAEALPTGKCVWPVPNNMNDVSAATDLSVFYSKIPKEFLTTGPHGVFSTGTNGYKFGNVSSIEEGSVNANVDISAFRFEKSGTAPSFTGLNAKRVKVRMLCPGGNFWLNNGSFSFNVKLSNGQLVNVGTGVGIATSRVAYGIIDQDISVGWNMLSHQYSLVIAQCKERTNQNQDFKRLHDNSTLANKIVPDGVTITDLIFNAGNGNYWPCNGTVVEVYEFVG